MLRQNWFYQDGMEMIGEIADAQLFYDNNCDAFYFVEDLENHIVITQITAENAGFQYCMEVMGEYKEAERAVWFRSERSLA